MYPPSNNNCNYSPNLSSLFVNNIPSPIQYEQELFFQSYHHDQYYLQQVPLLEDLSLHILAESIETETNPSNCTDSVKNALTSNQGPEGNIEGRENKGGDMMSSRSSIIRGRISKTNNKRSSNKDRHSKINTARGPRDRRMRLSLDAARKLFSLQDLLGFDKASKTVEWLLNKSYSAIEELSKGNEGAQLPHINKHNSCSTTTTGIGAICASNSISECEVISGTDETSPNDKNKETAKGGTKNKKKKANTARRAAFEPLTKESRNQARARARERTKIKRAVAHDLNPSGSWRPINKTCEEPRTHEQLTLHQEKQQLLGIKENNVDDCNLLVNGNWYPFSIFNYHEQNAGISNEHQFTDLQFCGKLWEG
ncbi:unnamed protein product [Withania somnifera]